MKRGSRMSRYRTTHAIQIAMLVIASLAGSARAGVSVGASFGYTHLYYSLSDEFAGSFHPKQDVVGIPGTQEWKQPGFRVGYLAPGDRWDINTDVGLMHLSGNFAYDETVFELLPQFQLNARSGGGSRPFVNGGVGIEYETAFLGPNDYVSATRPVVGTGIGVRKSVSDGHGQLRAELRYDYLPESKKVLSPTSSLTFPTTHMFSVKLGFDLLVAR